MKSTLHTLGWLCLLLLHFVPLWTAAQEPHALHYGVNEGMPSSETHGVIQDERGFIWFASDRGLVRYDGYEFKVYTTADGLPNDVVLWLEKDRRGRIWMHFLHEGLAYLEGDQIIFPEFNEAVKDYFQRFHIGYLHFDPHGNYWLSGHQYGVLLKVDSTNRSHPMNQNEETEGFLMKTPSGDWISGQSKSKRKTQYNDVFITTPDSSWRFDLGGNKFKSKLGARCLNFGEKVYVTQRNVVAVFSKETGQLLEKVILPAAATRAITIDRQKNLWIGMFNHGAVCFVSGDLNRPQYFLQKHTVSAITEDRGGGKWFTTLEFGVFYIPNQSVASHTFNRDGQVQPVNLLHGADNNVYLSTGNRVVSRVDVQKPFNPIVIGSIESEIFHLEKVNQKVFVGAGLFEKDHIIVNDSLTAIRGQGFCKIPGKVGLWLIPISNPPNDTLGIRYLRIRDIEKLGNFFDIKFWKDRLYSSSNPHLYAFEPDSLPQYQVIGSLDRFDILEIQPSESVLFLGTRNHGVVVYDGHQHWTIDYAQGLGVNRIECIAVHSDSLIWIGTKKGVYRAQINHATREVKLDRVTISNGLLSNEVNDLLYLDHRVWVATHKGLSWWDDRQKFQDTVAPPILLEQVAVNARPLLDLDSNEFDSEAQLLEFKMAGISFTSLGNLRYRYRMAGLETEWNESSNREVQYRLTPGAYTFEALARSHAGVWSKHPLRFAFTILPPVWQRWWFIALVVLLLVGSTVFGVRYRLQQVAHRNSLELRMAQSQHQALNAQLKPHFIFNALNSIHNYIRKNDKEQSSNYLLLFARLIRQILDNSGSSFVTLEQELQLVETYLKVEQLRFKERLQYVIEVDPELAPHSFKIPSQLIQPYVENAIWHGLMPKEGKGKLTLQLKSLGEYISCRIIDDGVGRAASASYKDPSYAHKSAGMEMGQQRLELVEAILKKNVRFKIIDLKDAQGQAMGTCIELTIPVVSV
ncbi:MAG: histidine kinase [Salibacteraceae bacterium]